MSAADQQGGPGVASLFPPPPPFFKLFSDDADGVRKPLPPEPPAPIQGTYQMFGELHTVREPQSLAWRSRQGERSAPADHPRAGCCLLQTEDGLPPLQARQLYAAQEDGTIGAACARGQAALGWEITRVEPLSGHVRALRPPPQLPALSGPGGISRQGNS